MKVKEAMTSNVRACRPYSNLAEAAALLWEGDCGVLPVVDDGGRLAGVVTDRDIAIGLGTRNRLPAEVPVGEVMTTGVHACAPDDDVLHALVLMRTKKVRRLAVLDPEGKLRGLLSLNDLILKAQPGGAKKTAKGLTYDDVMVALKGICEHRDRAPAPRKGG